MIIKQISPMFLSRWLKFLRHPIFVLDYIVPRYIMGDLQTKILVEPRIDREYVQISNVHMGVCESCKYLCLVTLSSLHKFIYD